MEKKEKNQGEERNESAQRRKEREERKEKRERGRRGEEEEGERKGSCLHACVFGVSGTSSSRESSYVDFDVYISIVSFVDGLAICVLVLELGSWLARFLVRLVIGGEARIIKVRGLVMLLCNHVDFKLIFQYNICFEHKASSKCKFVDVGCLACIV